jgi:ABC-type transport system involved in cytochrome bd biosynthesis fused ATPase/permease subunit
MLDPKSAGKLGESYGKGITDAVFGIVDVFKNAPAQKAANTQRVINQNKITEINNQVVRNNNRLREQAMREIAAEQEATMIAKMSPAQRQQYYKDKADAAKEAHRAKVAAERAHEEMMELVWVGVILFLVVPFMVWIGLLIWGMSDVMACYNMKGIIPLMKALCGH